MLGVDPRSCPARRHHPVRPTMSLTCVCVVGARTRPAASLPTRLEHREYLATVAAAERHRCLPSVWDAAASGVGGAIPGAAHAVAAASAVNAAAAAKTGLECIDAHPAPWCCETGISADDLASSTRCFLASAMPVPSAGASGGSMPSDAAGHLRGSGEAGTGTGAPAVAAARRAHVHDQRNA